MKKDVLWVAVGLLAGAAVIFVDKPLIAFIAGVQIPLLEYFFMFFTLLGTFFYVVAAGLCAVFWKQKKIVLTIWLSSIAAFLVIGVLKLIVQRPRPDLMLKLPAFFIETSSGFPSAHAAVAFSLIPLFFAMKVRWPIVVAVLVALSRVYLGVHYLSDVLFGSIIGYLCGAIVLHYVKPFESDNSSTGKEKIK